MATRLQYERLVREGFPELLWIRAATSESHHITIYTCTADLVLSEDHKKALLEFLREHGSAACIHHVKHFFELIPDNVFPISDVPEAIQAVALTGGLNKAGIAESIKCVFPMLDSENIEVDMRQGVVFFAPADDLPVLEQYDVVLLEALVSEILPLGIIAKLRRRSHTSEQS